MNLRIISFAALVAIAAVIAFYALRDFGTETGTGFEQPGNAGEEQAEKPRGPARALDLESLRGGVPPTVDVAKQETDPTTETVENEALGKASLSGRIVAEGLPVSGALVRAERPRPRGFTIATHGDEEDVDPPNSTRSGTDGGFEINGLEAGSWQLEVEHETYQSARAGGLEVDPEEQRSGIEIEMKAGLQISGRVIDAAGRPVVGARVDAVDVPSLGNGPMITSGRKHARTDFAGSFKLRGLMSREYNLRARAAGFMDQRQRAHPGSDEVEITLSPAALVWGVVRDARSGEPIENARVASSKRSSFFERGADLEVLHGTGAARLCSVDDAHGLFAIPDVATSGLRLDADAPGYGRVRSAALTVVSGERLRFDLALEPEARIEGRIIDPEGRAVSGAKVQVRPISATQQTITLGRNESRRPNRGAPKEKLKPREAPVVLSDAEGYFVVAGLAPGQFEVRAESEGFSPTPKQAASVVAGETVVVELQLGLLGSIIGRALDAQGLPAAGAAIDLSDLNFDFNAPNERKEARSTTTGEDGRFSFADVAAGDWTVSMGGQDMPGFVVMGTVDGDGTRKQVHLPAGETIEVLLSATPRASVTGVVRAAGRPVADAQVKIGKSDDMFDFGGTSTLTDAEGRYRFDAVETGRQTIQVKAPGAPIATKVEIDLVANNEQQADIDLPGGAIEGVLRSTEGERLAGLEVGAHRIDPDGETQRQRTFSLAISSEGGYVQALEIGAGRVRSDAEGRYRVDYLPDGDFEIEVKGAPFIAAKRKPIQVRDGQVTRGIDFELQRGHTLEVELVSKTRSFYFVTIRDSDESSNSSDPKASQGGKVTFKGLKPGSYAVSAQRMGMGDDDGRTENRVVVISNRDEKLRIDFD